MSTPELSQVGWRKSSLSGNGQDCVEVGVWRKSSRSGAAQDCVEVRVVDEASAAVGHKADMERVFLVRDSKDPGGPVLAFAPAGWDAFVGAVKGGEFGDLS
ncbi:DUF397 domain-containing protein [Planomonospora venezuelensis]|uniref:DUF397 domain-containing protein n=1 Tax=Planomonospora venezuelensis TaxID=1999 RepID=A0A841D507_PLAVE|nr:DUF397 domain-containing protein [Planomonospora venezuelensis]MBB5963245.1 hypothetical protein [Planomonospora venezuelensis]GIN01337.1 hypothetical protein Pve01_29950 [Planomonospora venezuelensis]